MPIIEHTDLRKGGGDTVVFTSLASERAQGVLGETDLRVKTGKLAPGTMSVVVDILQHGVAWTEKFELMTQAGRSIDQLSSDIMGEWAARKEEDDFQMCALRNARLISPGTCLYQVGGGAIDALKSTDTMTTTVIEETKGYMSAIGAKSMVLQKEASGADKVRYLMFLPSFVARPLRNSAAFLAALTNADVKGKDNRLFTGEYGVWDNTVVFPHEIKIDEAAGRQGSPLAPIAKLGTALADGAATEITGGGGSVSPASLLGDFFANFPGYLWKFVDGETPPADSGPHYAMIYNTSGSDIGKYEIIKYTTGNDGNKITGITRGSATTTGGTAGGGNVTAQAASRFTLVHPVGSLIFPCTFNGVPYGYGLVLGAEAIAYAKGKFENMPTYNEEGYKNLSDRKPQLKGVGIKSIRGLDAYKNAAGAINGIVAVRAAMRPPVPIQPVAYTS